MATSNKLTRLSQTKLDIKNAIEDKGQEIGDIPFSQYADKIANIETGYNWVLATDNDFEGTTNSRFKYIGTDKHIVMPLMIKGVQVTSYSSMFNSDNGKLVEGVISNNSNVTNMTEMFFGSQATTLDLSSFDTSSVTDMGFMFYDSRATTLDLSSFDTSKVNNMTGMFSGSAATIGYARTQADADRFNASSNKPAGLTFVVK